MNTSAILMSATLVPDVAVAERNITTLLNGQQLIDAYVMAVLELPLGAKPLLLDGQPVGQYDPLSGLPGLEMTLQQVQDHAVAFTVNFGQPIHIWAISGLPSVNTTVQNQFVTLRTVLDAVGSGGTPTPAQRKTAGQALQTLSTALAANQSVLSACQTALTTFLNALTDDYATLTQGTTALDAMIPQLKNTIVSAELQYMGGPGGAAIADMIGQIGNQMLTALQNVDTAVNSARIDHLAMDSAMSDLAALLTIIQQKAGAVATQLANATDADWFSLLQGLASDVAQTAWNQLTTYVANSGL